MKNKSIIAIFAIAFLLFAVPQWAIAADEVVTVPEEALADDAVSQASPGEGEALVITGAPETNGSENPEAQAEPEGTAADTESAPAAEGPTNPNRGMNMPIPPNMPFGMGFFGGMPQGLPGGAGAPSYGVPAEDEDKDYEKINEVVAHSDDPEANNPEAGESGDKLDHPIDVRFKKVKLRDAVSAIVAQSNSGRVNVIFDSQVDQEAEITATYYGFDPEEALRTTVEGLDLHIKTSPRSGAFIITPYEERIFDVVKLFDIVSPGVFSPSEDSSLGGTSGISSGGDTSSYSLSGSSGSESSTSEAEYSDFGGYIEDLSEQIQKLLSANGVLSYLPSGAIYVKDRPSRVAMVEQYLNVDERKRDNIRVKIDIVRVDYNDTVRSGVDWQGLMRGRIFNDPFTLNLNPSFVEGLPDGNVFTINNVFSSGNFEMLIKALESYGDVDVVQSWTATTMAGTTLPFELTQSVWYSQGNVIQVVNDQTITSPQMMRQDVGLRLVLNPIKYSEGRYLLNSRVELSSVVGIQQIQELEFPNIERNFTSLPIMITGKEGTAIISGFKIRSDEKKRVGVPLLSKLPILGWLFGFAENKHTDSELSVIISFEVLDAHKN